MLKLVMLALVAIFAAPTFSYILVSRGGEYGGWGNNGVYENNGLYNNGGWGGNNYVSSYGNVLGYSGLGYPDIAKDIGYTSIGYNGNAGWGNNGLNGNYVSSISNGYGGYGDRRYLLGARTLYTMPTYYHGIHYLKK